VRWRKLGRVYCADGETDWARSHAYIPTVTTLDATRLRVYVAFLDRHRIGRVGWVDVDAGDPRRVRAVSRRPALDVGPPGAFDEHGVSPICLVRDGGATYLSYVGWQRGTDVRYRLFAGLAESREGGERFERVAHEPLLPPSQAEPILRSAAHILRDRDRWRTWYVAGDRWVNHRGRALPVYNVRHLESREGLTAWGPAGTVVLDTAGKDEHGFGRPFVERVDGTYRMWYSIRTLSRGYRLGYAESPDGLAWARRDGEVGIDVSPEGWDSEMLCFGCVHAAGSETYLFYNGNGFGETGFGVAVLDR
jgi:hypothetical protein